MRPSFSFGRLGAVLCLGLATCQTQPASETHLEPAHGSDGIIVAGRLFPIDAPVVLWDEEGGYNAYLEGPQILSAGPSGKRYRPGRSIIEGADPGLEELREAVDLLVLHYDACGFSRFCFQVLHDERKLSSHFLLDVDGTIYQTLDLKDQAWHARHVNPRSIGVEIAHVGIDTSGEKNAEWYAGDGGRIVLNIPRRYGDPHIRGEGPFHAARDHEIEGTINGRTSRQVDFTEEQYASLVELTAALHRIFPRIEIDAPRAADGRVRADMIPREEHAGFSGILGHYHVVFEKTDPGPAFDWERYLESVRARVEAQRAEIP